MLNSTSLTGYTEACKICNGKHKCRKMKKHTKGTFIWKKDNEELEMSADTELKEETEIQTSENSEKASADSEPEKKERPAGTSFGLLLLAGVYLLYTGYKLCANVLKGEEGASWGFFIAGAAFLIIGAGMLFVAAKTAKQRSDAKKAAAAEEEKEHPVEPVQEPKRMTIAERAKLAGNVAEKEAQEAQNSDTEEEKDKDEDQE